MEIPKVHPKDSNLNDRLFHAGLTVWNSNQDRRPRRRTRTDGSLVEAEEEDGQDVCY